VRSRWLDIGQEKEKERGQYPAILNKQGWSIKDLYGKITTFLRDTAVALSIQPKIPKSVSKRGQMVRQWKLSIRLKIPV